MAWKAREESAKQNRIIPANSTLRTNEKAVRLDGERLDYQLLKNQECA